jgi:hypothetical protein
MYQNLDFTPQKANNHLHQLILYNQNCETPLDKTNCIDPKTLKKTKRTIEEVSPEKEEINQPENESNRNLAHNENDSLGKSSNKFFRRDPNQKQKFYLKTK